MSPELMLVDDRTAKVIDSLSSERLAAILCHVSGMSDITASDERQTLTGGVAYLLSIGAVSQYVWEEFWSVE